MGVATWEGCNYGQGTPRVDKVSKMSMLNENRHKQIQRYTYIGSAGTFSSWLFQLVLALPGTTSSDTETTDYFRFPLALGGAGNLTSKDNRKNRHVKTVARRLKTQMNPISGYIARLRCVYRALSNNSWVSWAAEPLSSPPPAILSNKCTICRD